MRILSFNPGHDGAVALLEDGKLMFSIEAEKDSNYRYSPVSSHDVLNALGHLHDVPDAICTGGWWPHAEMRHGSAQIAGYRGVNENEIIRGRRQFFGQSVHIFSSSHERSHLLCAFGLSDLAMNTPFYALVWEGAIGAFYEVDAHLNMTLLADVLHEPGNRYTSIYGLADPTFPKNAPFSRFSDAGKLMALASFSKRTPPTVEDEHLIAFLLSSSHVRLDLYKDLEVSPYYNVGIDNEAFRNFAGIFSDRIFDCFYQFAKSNMNKGLPLLVAGGCGLNCDWNTKWKESKLFSDVFVPPVANDSGSAIGTAIDAQRHFTGNAKIEWNVYAGLNFDTSDGFDIESYCVKNAEPEVVADMLAFGLVLGWVNGRYEIGPRALGNRSIIAAPFDTATRIRLNEIKQREQFRPIAPVCLAEDAAEWFGCDYSSPFMLYTHQVRTDALAAVTHVNGTARIQTVTRTTNRPLYELLTAFKKRTGFGVLCNTSLNFNGRGFINSFRDLSEFARGHGLDGFVVAEKAYLLRASKRCRGFLYGQAHEGSRAIS